MTDQEKLVSILTKYIAAGYGPKEVLSRLRSSKAPYILSNFLPKDPSDPPGKKRYQWSSLGLSKFLADQGKEDEAFVFQTAHDVEEHEAEEKRVAGVAKWKVNDFQNDHPVKSFFMGKKGVEKMRADEIEKIRLDRLAARDEVERKAASKKYGSKKSLGLDENTIAQFFTDTGFQPPKGHNMFDFSFGYDSGVDADMKGDGYDGIPGNVADIVGDLNDPEMAKEHPVASIYGDYYMFVDPGMRNNLDNKEPLSSNANRTNMDYHKKDLSRIDSASDVHLETLEQPVSEFPRHQQIKSQMSPSILDSSEAQSGEIVLQQPQVIEGVKYPAGTRIRFEEMSAEDIYTEDEINDGLYENPDAKLCPLCYEAYVGDVCPSCKSGKPGPGATPVGDL